MIPVQSLHTRTTQQAPNPTQEPAVSPFTYEVTTSHTHRLKIPYTATSPIDLVQIEAATGQAASMYRQAYGLSEEVPIPEQTIFFHPAADGIVLTVITEERQA